MLKRQYLCASSLVTTIVAAGLLSSPAQAATPTAAGAEVDEVVVTGTLLEGAQTDGALPVNVIGVQDLKKTGSPNNVDLIKRLSEVGSVQGDQNRYSGLPQGAGSINFRGLQSSRSLVVLNGRRFPNQPGSFIGRFQNTNLMPTFAIGRIELLKQGGAVTYGADGVGGVANFITQKARDGVEMGASYRYITDAEDPDYDAYVNAGKVWERGDIFASLGYQHRGDLKAITRDFADNPFLINPDGLAWTTTSNPGAYTVQLPNAAGTVFTAITPVGVGLGRYVGDRQMSGSGVVRDKYCTAMGGFNGWSATPSPVCLWHLTEQDYLAEHQETYQAFVAGNYQITDGIKLHTEVLYAKYELPDVALTPYSEGPSVGPAGGADTFTTTGLNPAVAQFLNDYDNVLPQDRLISSTAFTAAQIAALTDPANPGRIGLPNAVWRLFGQGGIPRAIGGASDGSDQGENVTNEMFRIVNAFSGDLGEFMGVKWGWEFAHTYSFSKYRIEMTDVLASRMQAALNGFGSAAGATPCNPIAANRGNVAAGCYYINPFSSAVAGDPNLGLSNPGFIGTGTYAGYAPGTGLQNNPAVLRWMQVPIYVQRTQDFNVVDALLRGEGGITLPGGPISFAVGAQYRMTKERLKMSDLQKISYSDPADPLNRTIFVNPCADPALNPSAPTSYPNTGAGSFTACPGVRVGVFMSGSSGNRTQAPGQAVAAPDRRRFPVESAFFEVNLPVLESLNVNIAGRYEKFYSDQIGGKDNTVFVPAGSAIWRATDHLAFRAGYGQSFTQVDPPRQSRTTTTAALNAITPAAQLISIANTEIRPETSEYYNVGSIVQIGNFQGSVDFWSIEVNDYTVRTITSGLLLTALTDVKGAVGNATINCSSPLLTTPRSYLTNDQGQPVPFFQLKPGLACVQGTTRVGDIGVVTLRPGYNSGSLTTQGLDVALSYLFEDVWGGSLGLRADATYNISYKLSKFEVEGVEIAPENEGVGTRNSYIGGNGQLIPRWRGGFSVNYQKGRHNLNFATRYTGPVIDDRNLSTFAAGILTLNANAGDANGTSIACTSVITPPIPTGAGTANNGGPLVNGVPTIQPAPTGGTIAAGSVGFQASCTQQVLSGRIMEHALVSDLTYTIDLPRETKLTFSIFNLFDSDPPFAREALSYNHYFNSPLGRNYKVSFTKRF